MSRQIDWNYHRPNCSSCHKAQEYFAAQGVRMAEQVNAMKVPIDSDQTLALLAEVTELVVVRGQKVYEFDLRSADRDDAQILSLIIGRSGKLRAPTLRIGKRLVVGFQEALYQRVLH